jgi:ankyrin repeat protein
MASLAITPDAPLLLILRYIGRPSEFYPLLGICRSWRERFDEKDSHLWRALSLEYGLTVHSLNVKRNLRCTEHYRKAFLKAYFGKVRAMEDAHDFSVIQSRQLLQMKNDQPKSLDKIIHTLFPDVRYFNVNRRCKTMEDNTLLTLAARNCQNKCMKLLVQRYAADVNVSDVGGFTPLILCAYQGNFAGVLYLLSKGASIRSVGRLRSGPCLTAEHWAAVMGNMEIFRYLHAMRRRNVIIRKNPFVPESTTIAHVVSMVEGDSSNGACSVPPPLAGSSLSSPSETDSLSDQAIGPVSAVSVSSCISAHSSNDGYIKSGVNSEDSITTTDNVSAPTVGTHDTSLETGESSTASASTQDAAQCFCYCRRGFVGQMIACDQPGCAVEWFHYDCVGLRARVS